MKTIDEFARTILYGTSLEEKLLQPDSAHITQATIAPSSSPALEHAPRLPGRPARLSLENPKKSHFPELARIHEPQVRGEILHFFANHELLALELMALLLLRFPEAPQSFRLGILRTMSEEQGHLRLYLSRMKTLGIEFGDLPVNGYFWHVLSPMRSPLEFVTQMSLTFEQANLDFSLFYRDQVAETGDEVTTQVLDQVYREEIGHVKHGLEWFNRWRVEDPCAPAGESDWDAYRRLLPPPLTPRRAKGLIFDLRSRQLAGFSELFIRELELFSGSKGRPPVLWLYNPFCDAEIARGKPGFSPKAAPKRWAEDLEHLPMFLASSQDVVLVSKKPGLTWLSSMKDAGFAIPEWASKDTLTLKEPKLGGFEPWGWSPESLEFFRPIESRLTATPDGNAAWCKTLFAAQEYSATPLGGIFSKAWSVEFLKLWMDQHPHESQSLGSQTSVGRIFSDWPAAKAFLQNALQSGTPMVAKAPWSTSGNGVRRVLHEKELEGPLGGWIQNILLTQSSVVLEPWLDKVDDLSIQIEIKPDGIQVLEARRFLTGPQFEYRGTFLGPFRECMSSSSLRFFSQVLPIWKTLARDLGHALKALGYQGPVGIDAMIYQRSDGTLALKPIVEINPRWTMGRVALSLEKNILPGVAAAWTFTSWRVLKNKGFASPQTFALWLSQQFPLQLVEAAGGRRLASGALPTQDSERECEVMTTLWIGEKALQCAQDFIGKAIDLEA
jgi:uncharacterized ferritin-like protein (DUF455 family)